MSNIESTAKQIFESVCDLPPANRQQQLDERCGENSGLRAEVISLLEAHDHAGDFMGAPTADFVVSPSPTKTSIPEEPGTVIDRYKLLEAIGEGGFGVVYMAQQTEPVKRRVALKIIKLGMDTKQVVARFEAERQALAMMDHQNIAKVIDGGETSSGRPYFVMELVRGEPITQYCDRGKIGLRGRLEMFQQVCNAVQHAHQKGIIHRDIKPSNVLVTTVDDQPVVKVIDFGIAKATSSELTEKTLFTEFRQVIGTPQYMSPEQAESTGTDVDTRSDVYSLGVLLYEMLTSRTPIDPQKLGSAAWHELQRIICDEEPTKPSTLVSSGIADADAVAVRRDTQANRLGMFLRGDLDWIVLKSLEKDRSRRYESASGLAADIARFLNDDPVEATPPSRVYRLRKFAKRHRSVIATVSAVMVALLIGIISTTVMAVSAQQARNYAMAAQKATQDAWDEAKRASTKASRAAIIAGSTVALTEDQATSLADEWSAELTQQRQAGASDASLAREECQFASWYALWLLTHKTPDKSVEVIDRYYAGAIETLGLGDPSVMALINAKAVALTRQGAGPQAIARCYDELMQSLPRVQGKKAAMGMMVEYAKVLADADRYDDATRILTAYLEDLRAHRRDLEPIERLRMNKFLDSLAKWGETQKELYQQLVDLRSTGTTQPETADGSDRILASDLQKLQGKWRWRHYEKGKVVGEMIQTFSENTFTTRSLDADGDLLNQYTGTFQLSRSGVTKLMTVWASADADRGTAFIYRVESDKLYVVGGLLTSPENFHKIQYQVYTRIDSEAP